ncbi:class I SAM-dependent methyltransferase [Marininema halotolerans]|uniref:Methyltransferase domain-containing protein n=1 Tax=Marininema halotolerans TaxID=1155944 RepID=A0A1I6RPX7_9BACL|nr:class I SAM-dependent methyltransferase [Marininema halotolerans]SFS66498.1 hypothetical protein SAMN05444972_105256 [Marininema halotolerans]
MKDIFTDIYQKNRWNGPDSVSGTGSSLAQTRVIIRLLPRILRQYHIHSMLDAPCGDFHWMKEVASHVPHYIGGDIVPGLIRQNQQRYTTRDCSFRLLDITRNRIPRVDLIFCRDCFVHFSFVHIKRALTNFKKSNARYLLTTTFPQRKQNSDQATGHHWRPINLQLAPFHFPPPLALINERCTEGHGRFIDKSLGLWKLANLS